MINDVAPYPAYRRVDLRWLERVPEHWQLRRVKTILRERGEKGFPDEPLLAATQTKGVVKKDNYENRTVLALKDLDLLKLVRVGDFVISLRSFQGGIEYARDQGIISPAYTVIYPVENDTHGYLSWLFKSKPYIDNLSLFVTGIRQGQSIDYERLARSELPLPPSADRAAIVRFLEHADRKIRRAVRAKQKLIALLDEQRRGAIHRAVTRGLDPDVCLRPSGVDWLGDVPTHWDIRRLKFLATISTGGRDSVDRVDDGEYPFYVRSQTVERINTYSFDGEAVLTAGDGAGVAKVFHYAKGKFDFHQRVYKFSDFHLVSGEFFFNYFRSSLKFEAFQGTAKSTVDSLRLPMLASFPVVIPPGREQDEIVAWINREGDDLNRSADAARREIGLLREYRARLIADVVTGNLDVREASTWSMDEPDALEQVEEIEVEERDLDIENLEPTQA